MAIHGTAINGMGGITETSPGVFVTAGMKEEDMMAVYEDILVAASIRLPADLAVSQRAAGANLSVDVAPGAGMVLNSNYTNSSIAQTRFWRFKSSAIENVGVAAANGSNPRIDLVIARKTSTTPNDDANNVFVIESSAANANCQGVPAASPVAKVTPADSILLATILVGTSVSSIVNANITDARVIMQMKAKDFQVYDSAGVARNLGNIDSSGILNLGDTNASGFTINGRQVWWEELGRLSNSAQTSITVSSLPARKYLKIMFLFNPSTGATLSMRFNGDSGNNYAYAFVNPYGGSFSPATSASSANLLALTDSGAQNLIGDFNVVNISNRQKGVQGNIGGGTSAGAGGRMCIGAWNNTAAQISSVVFSISSGNLGAAELIVLGHN